MFGRLATKKVKVKWLLEVKPPPLPDSGERITLVKAIQTVL